MKIMAAVSIAFTILISVTGCASDDDEAPVESRIKNSMGEEPEPQDIRSLRLFKDDYIMEDEIDFLDRDAKLDLMRHHIDDDIFKGMYEDTDIRGEPEPPVDPSYAPFNSSSVTFDEEGNLIRE